MKVVLTAQFGRFFVLTMNCLTDVEAPFTPTLVVLCREGGHSLVPVVTYLITVQALMALHALPGITGGANFSDFA
ncbi:hypothetical protein THTE_3557 [Thermogutta terrifontis]|uniref:Uncharacterized protein n=1 Tax=Thermogutta terrifontis TaxID=1331910 RepID=A0A286RJM0_9BACT|nr:hypothetical protein THTE_3557 [Thermogutta terrifontis]